MAAQMHSYTHGLNTACFWSESHVDCRTAPSRRGRKVSGAGSSNVFRPKAITERATSKEFQNDHSIKSNPGGVMNPSQLWKVVSIVLLACGLASAQKHITVFDAPGAGTGAGQGTGGF